MFTAIIDIVSAFTLARGAVRASLVLHNHLVTQILHASLAFFDQNPLGRIINRVSHDMDMVDLVMPFTVRSMINTILISLGTIAVIGYTTPVFLCSIPPVGILYFCVQVNATLLLACQRRLIFHNLCLPTPTTNQPFNMFLLQQSTLSII